MKKLTRTTELFIYDNIEDLPAEIRELIHESKRAATTAYAPYSHFRVGAAVRVASGEIIPGSNQENAAYPSGLCAERVAVYAAAAKCPGQVISAIAIHAADYHSEEIPVSPCGDCRQSIFEYEHRQRQPIPVYLTGSGKTIWKFPSLRSLLPFPFEF
ncbi:MAG: cytidine deaminase [Bacteroidia bacterium]